MEIGYGLLPWSILAGFALLGAIAPWWLVEMEGFGDFDEHDVEDHEGEAVLYGDGAEESLQAAPIGGGPLAANEEENDELLIEDPIGSQTLSRTTGHSETMSVRPSSMRM